MGQPIAGDDAAPVAAAIGASHLHSITGGQSVSLFSTVLTSGSGVFGQTGHCFST